MSSQPCHLAAAVVTGHSWLSCPPNDIFQFFKLSEVSGTGDHSLNTHFPMVSGKPDSFSFPFAFLPVLVIFKVTPSFLLLFTQCPTPLFLSVIQGHLIVSQLLCILVTGRFMFLTPTFLLISPLHLKLYLCKTGLTFHPDSYVDSSCQLTMIYLKPKSGNCSPACSSFHCTTPYCYVMCSLRLLSNLETCLQSFLTIWAVDCKTFEVFSLSE